MVVVQALRTFEAFKKVLFIYFYIFFSLNKNKCEKREDKSVGGLPTTSSAATSSFSPSSSLDDKDSADSSAVIYSRVNKQHTASKHLG